MEENPNILLIEDSEDDHFLFRELFDRTSYRTRAALLHTHTLKKGLALLAKLPVKLIILDLSLPDSDRLEGLKKLIQDFPLLPIIVHTGSDEMDLAREAIQCGAQDYLVKGEFSPRDLEKSVTYAMDRHELLVQLKYAQELRYRAQLEGEEMERERIATDLHDSLGQVLTSLVLKIEHLNATLECRSILLDQIGAIRNFAYEAVDEYKAIAHNLRPPAVQAKGLIQAIRDFFNNNQFCFPGKAHFQYSPGLVFSQNEERELYMITKELFFNAIRHGKPENICLDIRKTKKAILYNFFDDGKGFNYQSIKKGPNGLGLESIESRVKTMKAKINWVTGDGEGTKVRIELAQKKPSRRNKPQPNQNQSIA